MQAAPHRAKNCYVNTLLPECIDNTYRGRKLAVWLFAFIVSVKIVQSVAVMFDSDSTVRSADGIPLDTYTPAGAQAVLAIWALSSVDRLIISFLCVLVLMRYRSVITFMFGLLVLQYLAREVTLRVVVPLVRTGSPPGPLVNFALFCLTIAGLMLSLSRQGHVPLDDSVQVATTATSRS
jgi:hypothetical protein